MKEEIKYVIKNKKGLYLLPYEEKKSWVDLINAQTFSIIEGKNKAEDYVDFCWLINEEVELIKVKIKTEIKEIENQQKNQSENKKEYIIKKQDYIKIKNRIKELYKKEYNEHGTSLKKFKMIHHIIYNIIRDKNYLKGIELNKRRYFQTHESLIASKEKIFNYKENMTLINSVYNNILSLEDMEKIKKKLKKQIE